MFAIDVPFAAEGREILSLLRKRAPESEIQPIIERITLAASSQGYKDTLAVSTDVYVTCICSLGAKSLSHVLSAIERCKERLLAVGPSAPARQQIISSVVAFWTDQPGVGINIIDKLLNYTILTPLNVIEWVFPLPEVAPMDTALLGRSWVYEMVATTMFKVSHRLKHLVLAANALPVGDEQKELLEQSIIGLRAEQAGMFKRIESTLDAIITRERGAAEMGTEGQVDGSEAELRVHWASAWKRVFARQTAVELATVTLLQDRAAASTAAAAAAEIAAAEEANAEALRRERDGEEVDAVEEDL
jgi:nuclear cap-binding protein subunit 1